MFLFSISSGEIIRSKHRYNKNQTYFFDFFEEKAKKKICIVLEKK